MDLVAGPQGSGKSTFFPVNESGFDAFNVDEHRKALNRGSAQNIPNSQNRPLASKRRGVWRARLR